MGIIKKIFSRKKGKEAVTVKHYAPDITLTPVDYMLPETDEQRIRRSERAIDGFLAKIPEPDVHCEAFYDGIIEKENDILKTILFKQRTEHKFVNRELSKKHEAELGRVKEEINVVREKIDHLQRKYHEMDTLYKEKGGLL